MKLTDLQRKTLTLIANGKVENSKGGYGAWRIYGASPTVVGRLISMGLAKWPDGWGGVAVITDAGRTLCPPPETADTIIRELAAMTTDEELGGDMSGDDAVSVLSGLIERARALV